LSIDGREVRVSHSEKPYFSQADEALETRSGALLSVGRARRSRWNPGSSAGSQALRRRCRRPVVLSETRARRRYLAGFSKTMHCEVKQAGGTYALRESSEAYGAEFAQENKRLTPETRFRGRNLRNC